MITRTKFYIYYIFLLSFMFLSCPALAVSAVSDTAPSGNYVKITVPANSHDARGIADEAVSPDDVEISDRAVSDDAEEIPSSVLSSAAKKIPDSIVSLSSGYVLVVDKKYQRIYVFHKDRIFTKVFEAPCSTGKHNGSKRQEGDKRTPDGIFFTTKVLRNPGPPEIYGSMAFPLDYPNLSDKRAGRNGSDIWIHGTTKSLLPQNSKGCVVLHDRDLKHLANFIHLNRTPVVISESVKWVPPNHVLAAKNELERILIAWNKAFMEKDFKKIDSLYMQGSEIKGKRREELYGKIRQMKFSDKHYATQPRDISILQDGVNAVIIFDQLYAVSENNFQGFYNKLILERSGGKWFVVDDATPPPRAAVSKLAKVEIEPGTTYTGVRGDIRDMVNRWLASWRSGDMKTYRECYASDFKSREMDIEAWIAHKTSVRETSRDIKISIDNLAVSAADDSASATFTQSYSSSKLKSKGRKTLELKKVGDEWKIYREIM